VTGKLNKILPNYWKKVAKNNKISTPELNLKGQKYPLQTNFETLKYLQQTMCSNGLCISKFVMQKVSQSSQKVKISPNLVTLELD